MIPLISLLAWQSHWRLPCFACHSPWILHHSHSLTFTLTPTNKLIHFQNERNLKKKIFYRKIVRYEKQQRFINVALKKFPFSPNWNKKQYRFVLKAVIKWLVSSLFYHEGTCYLLNLIWFSSNLLQTLLHIHFFK